MIGSCGLDDSCGGMFCRDVVVTGFCGLEVSWGGILPWEVVVTGGSGFGGSDGTFSRVRVRDVVGLGSFGRWLFEIEISTAFVVLISVRSVVCILVVEASSGLENDCDDTMGIVDWRVVGVGVVVEEEGESTGFEVVVVTGSWLVVSSIFVDVVRGSVVESFSDLEVITWTVVVGDSATVEVCTGGCTVVVGFDGSVVGVGVVEGLISSLEGFTSSFTGNGTEATEVVISAGLVVVVGTTSGLCVVSTFTGGGTFTG